MSAKVSLSNGGPAGGAPAKPAAPASTADSGADGDESKMSASQKKRLRKKLREKTKA
jgi:hypothetical protein